MSSWKGKFAEFSYIYFDIIIASVDNGAVVKRLSQKNGITKLVSENEDYPDIEDEEQNLYFWGVVAKVIREY